MRIGIDGGSLSNRRGFGRYARRMLAALGTLDSPHDYFVFVDRPSAAEVEVPKGFRKVVVDVRESPSRAASAEGRRRFSDMLAMSRAVTRAGLDILYFPASYSYFPVWGVPRVVMTMHDTLPLAHPELVFPNWKGRLAWTLKEHAAARRADVVITGSEAARRDLISWFKLPPDRVRVASEGADPAFGPRASDAASDAVLARFGVLDRKYLLYVGGISPNKNLPRLVEAFSRAACEGVQLLIVGDIRDNFHKNVVQVREAIDRHGVGDRVTLTGFVPDEELVYLYNRAEALVQPSLLEGFGLPPLEAMACGTPVLHSRAGSLPEVIGEAGWSYSPTDVEEMASVIRRFVADPGARAPLSALARKRAGEYAWERGAQLLHDAFDEIDPRRRRGQTA